MNISMTTHPILLKDSMMQAEKTWIGWIFAILVNPSSWIYSRSGAASFFDFAELDGSFGVPEIVAASHREPTLRRAAKRF